MANGMTTGGCLQSDNFQFVMQTNPKLLSRKIKE